MNCVRLHHSNGLLSFHGKWYFHELTQWLVQGGLHHLTLLFPLLHKSPWLKIMPATLHGRGRQWQRESSLLLPHCHERRVWLPLAVALQADGLPDPPGPGPAERHHPVLQTRALLSIFPATSHGDERGIWLPQLCISLCPWQPILYQGGYHVPKVCHRQIRTG